MSKISYIAGIPEDEYQDRASNLPEKPVHNYMAMTEGEFSLSLLAEQLDILGSFYPEISEYEAAKQQVYKALRKGVHQSPISRSNIAGVPDFVGNQILRAKRLTAPASKVFQRREGIGFDPLVELSDCNDLAVYEQDEFGRYMTNSVQYNECIKHNQYKKILNEHLEKSSHHILYNFVKNPNAQTATVAAKTVDHRGVIALWNKLSGISESNFKTWLRNGVMRNNATQGTEPFQPEETIELFKANAIKGDDESIGDPATVLAVIAIVKAVIAAVTATAIMIRSLKPTDQQLFNQSFDTIGLSPFGPEDKDWKGSNGSYQQGAGNENGNDLLSDQNLMYVAAGAIALYALNK